MSRRSNHGARVFGGVDKGRSMASGGRQSITLEVVRLDKKSGSVLKIHGGGGLQ